MVDCRDVGDDKKKVESGRHGFAFLFCQTLEKKTLNLFNHSKGTEERAQLSDFGEGKKHGNGKMTFTSQNYF